MDANTQVVQDIYAAFSRGDISFILAQLADDVDWHGTDAPDLPYHGSFRGPAETMKFFQGIGASVEVTAFEPETYLASGDEVFVTGSWSGIVRSTGKPFKSGWAMRWVFRNGKVATYRGFEDTAMIAAAFRP